MNITRFLLPVVALLIPLSSIQAEGDLTRQEPIVVEVQVGANEGTAWEPNSFELETGKLYKFIFNNDSPFQIDIDAPGLVSRVFTRKVQSYALTDGEMKRTAEIKGTITEFEIFAGQQVDWWFVPLRTTRSPTKVCCTSEEGAVAATISIK